MPVVARMCAQTPALRLYAAGSLREALTDVAQQFEAQGGGKVALTFGALGEPAQAPRLRPGLKENSRCPCVHSSRP